MKRNNIKIVLFGFLCVFLSTTLFANPDSLFYPKKRTLKSGPVFWPPKRTFLCTWIRMGIAKKDPWRSCAFQHNGRSSWFQCFVWFFAVESYCRLRYRFLEPNGQLWPHLWAQRCSTHRFKTVAFWSLPKCRHQSLAAACANGHVCARSVLCAG